MTADPSPAPRRQGRRPGVSTTRAAITQAARSLFAEQGYAQTSVRAIADRAGVDPALVHHYFGTKEVLFREVLEIPIDPSAVAARVLADGPEGAAERLVHTFIEVWDDPTTGPAMLGFFRRMLTDPPAVDLLRQFAAATVVRRVAAALLADLDDREAETRITLVLSQLLGAIVARKVLQLQPLADLPREELVRRLTPVVQLHLAGPAVTEGMPS